MYQKLNICPKKTLETMLESDRNFYTRPQNIGYKVLKEGGAIEIFIIPSETGWSQVFLRYGGLEYPLTKKKIRTSDLKHYFGL